MWSTNKQSSNSCFQFNASCFLFFFIFAFLFLAQPWKWNGSQQQQQLDQRRGAAASFHGTQTTREERIIHRGVTGMQQERLPWIIDDSVINLLLLFSGNTATTQTEARNQGQTVTETRPLCWNSDFLGSISQAKEVKIPVVEGACTVRQHCPSCRTKLHHRLVFAILNASMLGCLRSFFFFTGAEALLWKEKRIPRGEVIYRTGPRCQWFLCCTRTRRMKEETHERPEANAEMDAKMSKCGLK